MKACIMLAAGRSTRMGRWKMMLPWLDGTVLDSALANALAFCDRVILVTGYRAPELHQRYANRPAIQFCYNECYEQDMFSSVRCGAAAVSDNDFFVVPGDMPAIDPLIYPQLWARRSDTCLLPRCQEGNGHPVLLPPAMAALIRDAPADANLRALMQQYGRKSVPVSSGTIHWDLDTPAQYQRLISLQKNATASAHTS